MTGKDFSPHSSPLFRISIKPEQIRLMTISILDTCSAFGCVSAHFVSIVGKTFPGLWLSAPYVGFMLILFIMLCLSY